MIIGGPDDDVDVEYVVMLDDWLDGLGNTPEEELVRIRAMGAETATGGHDMSAMATSPLLGGGAGDAVYPTHLQDSDPVVVEFPGKLTEDDWDYFLAQLTAMKRGVVQKLASPADED